MRMRLTSRAVLGCAVNLFLTTGVGVLVFACFGIAQQPAEPKLPEGLRHVPADALGFVHFRAGDFLKSDFGKQLLSELRKDREASRGLQKIERFLGIEVADLESVTVLMLSPPTGQQFGPWDGPRGRPYSGPIWPRPVYKDKDKGPPPPVRIDPPEVKPDPAPVKDKDKGRFDDKKEADKALQVSVQDEVNQLLPDVDPRELMEYMAMSGPLFMVTSTKPLDRKKILVSQVFKNRQRDIYGPGRDIEPSVMFLSDRTVLLGAAWELARYSEQLARKPGPKSSPMQSALAMAATPHLIVAGGHVPAEIRRVYLSPFGYMPDSEMRVFAALSPLFPTEAAVAIDLGKNLDVTMRFTAPTEASAANALQAVKNLRVLGELALEKSNEAGEPGGWKLDLEKSLKKALAGAVIEQKGTLVRAQLKVELTPLLLKHFSKDIVSTLRTKSTSTSRDYIPAETPAEAMDKFREAIQNRHYDQAAIYTTKAYGDMLKRAHANASELALTIDKLHEYGKKKGYMTDRTQFAFHTLDPFPKNFRTGAAPVEKGDKAYSSYTWEAIEYKNYQVVSTEDTWKKLDSRMFQNALGGPKRKFMTGTPIELVKEGEHWKLNIPTDPTWEAEVRYYLENAKRYHSNLDVFRGNMLNERFTSETYESDILRDLRIQVLIK